MSHLWPVLIMHFILQSETSLILQDNKVEPYTPKSMAIVFSATVYNDGNGDDASKIPVRLEMVRCCQIKSRGVILRKKRSDSGPINPNTNSVTDMRNSGRDCNSMMAHSGVAHHIKPLQSTILRSYFLNKHILNRKGFCNFIIHGASAYIAPFRIDFDTQQSPSGTEAKKCENLDDDPLNQCQPINCIEKYSGFRSFYNSKLKGCEPTPLCEPPVGSHSNKESNSEVDHEEHFPSMVLDFSANKCINKSSAKSLKAREILDSDEKKLSVGVFTVAYGLALFKLTIAVFLTIICVLCICVGINFLCGCICDGDVCFGRSRRRSPKGDKNKIKYSPIQTEDDTIIEEIKCRREMKNVSNLSNNTDNLEAKSNMSCSRTQSNLPEFTATKSLLDEFKILRDAAVTNSKSKNNDEGGKGNFGNNEPGSASSLRKLSGAIPPSTKSMSSNFKAEQEKELEGQNTVITQHVAQPSNKYKITDFLYRLQNIGSMGSIMKSQKENDSNENDTETSLLYNDVLRAYGHNSTKYNSTGSGPNRNINNYADHGTKNKNMGKNSKNPTQEQGQRRQSQELPFFNSQLITMRNSPKFNTTIHKVQDLGSINISESGPAHVTIQNNGCSSNPNSNSRKVNNSSNNNVAKGTYHDYDSAQKRVQEEKQKQFTSISNNDERVSNASDRNRTKQEVDAGNWKNIPPTTSFNRFYKSEMAQAANFLRDLDRRQHESESPLDPPLKFEPYSYSSHCEPSDSPRMIRRIKEEPPIPLSMTHSKAKLATDSSTPEAISKNSSRSKVPVKSDPDPATMANINEAVSAKFSIDKQEIVSTSVSGRSSPCPSSQGDEGGTDTESDTESVEDAYEKEDHRCTTTNREKSKQLATATTITTTSTMTNTDLELERPSMLKITTCNKSTETLALPLPPTPTTETKSEPGPGQVAEPSLSEKTKIQDKFSNLHPNFDFGKPAYTLQKPAHTNCSFTFPPELDPNQNKVHFPVVPVPVFPPTSRSQPKSSVAESIYISALRFRQNISSYNHHLNLLNHTASLNECGITEMGRPEFFESETDNEFSMSSARNFGDYRGGHGRTSCASAATSDATIPNTRQNIDMRTVNQNNVNFGYDQNRSAYHTDTDIGIGNVPLRQKFEIIMPQNSQQLIHSPPTLTTSETNSNSEASSWSDYRINPNDIMDTCFFDNELCPLRRPSASDEMLQKRCWIDTYSSRQNNTQHTKKQ